MTIQEKVLDLVNHCPVGLLGNKDETGAPQIKAMLKTKNDGLKTFWFCTNTSSKRVKQLLKDDSACLYFYVFDLGSGAPCKGVMLSGIAEISYDDDIRRSFWHENMRIYYPQGALDPDFALIKFTAHKGNYYEALKNEDFVVE